MELDKRINEDYRIYTCFDTERAKEYIGEFGYFADDIEDFSNIGNSNLLYSMLKNVDNDSEFTYIPFNTESNSAWKFFLPEEFVNLTKPKEKKYRPFKDAEEFLDIFPMGQPIKFRDKEYKLEKVLIFNGYETLSSGNAVINMGTTIYTPQELFDVFELQKWNEEEWQPFGVEE